MKRISRTLIAVSAFAVLTQACEHKSNKGNRTIPEGNRTNTPIIDPKKDDSGVEELVKTKVSAAEMVPKTLEEIERFGTQSKGRLQALLAAVMAVEEGAMTFENTFGTVDEIVRELSESSGIISLVGATSLSEDIRTAAQGFESELFSWESENLKLNAALYKKLSASLELNRPQAGTHQERIAQTILADMKRNGSALNDEERAALSEIESKIIAIDERIDKAVNEDNGILIFTAQDLEGLNPSQLAKFENADGKYTVKTRVADQYETVMLNAKKPEIRRQTVLARNSRAATTGEDILNLIKLRAQKAKRLGYATWADYVIGKNMAKEAKTAVDFVNGFDERLNPKRDSDIAALLELKKRDFPDATEFGLEDYLYYSRIQKQEQFSVDPEEVKAYFEENQVILSLMGIYEKIFGLKLAVKPVTNGWVEGLLVVEASDAATGQRIGDVFLDLHPRDGKYGHFACFSMYTPKDGLNRAVLPSATIVGNWPEKTAEQPSLWTLDQVNTLFHEFGHGLHHIMGKSPYAGLASGFFTPGDFVEAPSQSLEYWLKDYNVITLLSKHYQTGSVMPKELFDRLMAAERLNRGYQYKRQMAFAKIDLDLHSRVEEELPSDVDALWARSNAILNQSLPVPAGSKFLASFTHITSGGYSAGYYGYGWADAISADIANEFAKSEKGFMNPELGMKLRHAIYESGNSRDVSDSIREFLGRDWNMDAFFNDIFDLKSR